MNLKLIEVQYAGDIEKECVVIITKEDDDLNKYMVVDNTYNNEGEPSNKHRHLYKFQFPKSDVKKGDFVVLYSKEGENIVKPHSSGNCQQHYIFWNSQNPIWNKDGDRCHLIRIEEMQSVDVT